ncbi:MAG: hypothetical protein HYZ45_09850 [Burkholderiales bacterium]|nr:hypothetical protein [Burkholderiales bacterium]
MKWSVQITELRPCGCDAEGEVRATLEDGTPFCFYYQGPDDEAENFFQVGQVREVEIIVRMHRMATIEEQQTKLIFSPEHCTVQIAGQITAIEECDDEPCYRLQSSLPFHVEIENDDATLALGSWATLEGELWATTDWW